MQVRDAVRRLDPELPARARFVAVSFEPRAALAARRAALAPDLFELCCDPGRRTYAAFGLPRLGLRRLLGGRTLRLYAARMLRGEVARGIGSDVHQMGGDFLLDRDGVVRLAHPSREPADRPEAGALVRELGRWS